MTVRSYLGLGSNLRTPKRQIQQALQQLRTLPHTYVKKHAHIYFNQAIGLRAQPPFHNTVVLLETTLPASRLLHYCQRLEQRQGRVRKRRWGARTLDIDILLYSKLRCHTATLTLPHPELTRRDFVLIPLLQLTPELQYSLTL